ncbi:uncharacterized protein LOC124810251 isoform X2 [Hydra vulgaris]|uniref:uncharacterized protein LOC124810251 isoform X2 n=1 Tax=Hydra vulgaris TaxID=6087 RepID=UPI001F5F3206|nr:uncharacterized protein LOC124810389 isoform X3 [Hydra vulgaris]
MKNMKKIDAAKSICQEPEVGWLRFSGRILSTADTESEAKEKCKYAEDTSNVDELYLKNRKSQSCEEDSQVKLFEKKKEIESIFFKEELSKSIKKKKTESTKGHMKFNKSFEDLNKSPEQAFIKPDVPLIPRCSNTSDDVDFNKNSSLTDFSFNLSETYQRMPNSSTIVPFAAAENSGVCKTILRGLEQIKETQKFHSKMIQNLLQRFNIERDIASVELPEGLTFPVTTMEELDKALEILANVTTQRILVHILFENGGQDISEFVNRNMTYLIGNVLARQLNLTGQKNKRGFIKTILYNILYTSIKMNTSTKECTKKQLEEALSKWFGNARDRE